MDNNSTNNNNAKSSVTAVKPSAVKSNRTHRLNVPTDTAQMSKSDKATLRAWEYTYKNRDKRLD